MEPNHAWTVIIVFPVIAAGIVFAFFPYIVIRTQTRIRRNSEMSAGLRKEERDRLPLNSILYSARSEMYGEDYFDRLQREMEHPEQFKGLVLFTRLFGMFMLLLSTLGISLYILAFLSGNLAIS